jgi:YHS domain-containing protein/plastocyanin
MKWITRCLAIAALLAASPVLAHDVKDPVCRMTVDSDTAKYRQKLGNKSFYFCSKQCLDKFAAQPEKYEKLAAQLERQDLHEYAVELKTGEEPVAGQPVKLELAVRYADTKEPVREFEIVHERLLHLIMTTEDMSWFEHQHPVRGDDGLFRLTWTFPRPGQYRLYTDFTPSDGDNQVLPLTLTVGGGPAKTVPLTPDRKLVKQVGDLRFELKVQPRSLRMEQPALLTYTVRDRQGRPVKDMQPFIGAMGHLLAISQDGKEVIHTHVLQSASQPSMGSQKEPFRVTPAMISETGPVFSFKLTLPSGGLYKTWAQFQHAGRVYTVPFTFDVEDLWAKTTPAASGNTVQRARVVIDSEYQPSRLTVRAGKPVELTFIRRAKSDCAETVWFPDLGLKRTLKVGESATIRFTPSKTGTLGFTCGMKMYRGQVIVK